MAFPTPITDSLDALERCFSLPKPRKFWGRGRRLGLVRRGRQVEHAWRALKHALVAAGAPPFPCPLTVNPMALGDEDRNHFELGLLSERCKIVMRSWDTGLGLPDVDDDLLPLGNVLALLHEQAHARLSLRLNGWVESLPADLRYHMDWMWEQVAGHPGWRTFHEIYADTSAVAWCLVVGQHSAQARELSQSLLEFRKQNFTYHFSRNTFTPYWTSKAIGAVLAVDPSALATDTEAHVQRITVACFENWLNEQGGRKRCQTFVDHYSQLSSPRFFGLALTGMLPMTQVFGETTRQREGLLALARTLPQHPLLGFTQAQHFFQRQAHRQTAQPCLE